MTHTYALKGMTCNSCVAKVAEALQQLPGILDVDISLKPPTAVLEMEKHVELSSLQKALDNAGEYVIESQHSKNLSSDQIVQQNALTTYKPLLLLVTLIVLTSLAVSFANSGFSITLFMRAFMAGFFLAFSFFKFLDLDGFASSYATYDLLARKWPAYGYVYPFIELALGLAYAVGFAPVATNLATIVVMGFSSLGVIRAVMSRNEIRCACLGTVFNLPMSTITIIEDVGMIGMAALMLFM